MSPPHGVAITIWNPETDVGFPFLYVSFHGILGQKLCTLEKVRPSYLGLVGTYQYKSHGIIS